MAEASKTAKGGSAASTAVAFAVLTALAAGIGGILGQQLTAAMAPASDATVGAEEHAEPSSPDSDGSHDEAPAEDGDGHGGETADGHGGADSAGEAGQHMAPPGKPRLVLLDPILTNLEAPDDAWIRLEATLVVTGPVEEESALTARIAADVTAHLRTLPLTAIEGATGLRYLTEDLNDLVAARSGGTAREIVIRSLVVQ